MAPFSSIFPAITPSPKTNIVWFLESLTHSAATFCNCFLATVRTPPALDTPRFTNYEICSHRVSYSYLKGSVVLYCCSFWAKCIDLAESQGTMNPCLSNWCASSYNSLSLQKQCTRCYFCRTISLHYTFILKMNATTGKATNFRKRWEASAQFMFQSHASVPFHLTVVHEQMLLHYTLS